MASLNRHLLVLVLGALLPILVVGAALAALLVHNERRSTERSLQQNTRLLSQALDAELQRSFAGLQALARNDSLRRGDLRTFYDEAADVRDALGLWDNVLLLSPKADHLLNLMRPFGTALPPVPQPEGTLEASSSGKPYVSNVLRGRVDTEWLMYIAYPVIHDGSVRYVIGVTMSHRYWSRWLRDRAPADLAAGIIDRNHAILARTEQSEAFVGKPVQAWYRDALERSGTNVVRGPSVSDADVVVAFDTSAVSGWRVNLFASGERLDAPMRQVATGVSAAMLAALGIAAALALWRATVLTRSVRALHDALQQLRNARRVSGLRSSVGEIQAAMTAAEHTADVLADRADSLARAQEAAGLGLWDWDVRTDEVNWSAGIFALLGVPADSVRPSVALWRDHVVPEDRDRVMSGLAERAAKGGRFAEEFRIVRADGETRWLATIGSADLDEHGRPARMQGVTIDITARKQAELMLSQSESTFRTIANAAPAFVWVTAPDGALTFINRRWLDYTGQSEPDALGFGWIAAMHGDDADVVVPLWRHCSATGEAYEGECRYRRVDGEYRWHAFRALPTRGPDGAIAQWVGCAVDVHDARQAQEALREADRRKDEFLATLAHELRNPLAPIRNGLQIIKLRNVGDRDVAAAQSMMERQVVQMVRLIDDLLDVSRISRGRLELKREPVELARIVHQALEACAAQLGSRLTVSLPDEPAFVDGDPVRLAQVLSNLLNNAAKYTDASGRVDLVARADAHTVTISVRDSGIGIAPEQLPRLFQMFAQANSALSRSQGGLGIGLALARSLVELHGGTIEARSAGVGTGSEFIVRLPRLVAQPPASTPAAQTMSGYGGPPRRVLVVDDVDDNVESLVALLRLDGHTTATARDGEEAIAQAERFAPDVVLLDLGLPKIGGIDACRIIRGKRWGRTMTIVALTGWGQDADRRLTLDAGFDAHLVKPVAHDVLREILAAARSAYAR